MITKRRHPEIARRTALAVTNQTNDQVTVGSVLFIMFHGSDSSFGRATELVTI
jgi:hypothetical protein